MSYVNQALKAKINTVPPRDKKTGQTTQIVIIPLSYFKKPLERILSQYVHFDCKDLQIFMIKEIKDRAIQRIILFACELNELILCAIMIYPN